MHASPNIYDSEERLKQMILKKDETRILCPIHFPTSPTFLPLTPVCSTCCLPLGVLRRQCTVSSRCSGFRPFVIAHFNAILSTCYWFQRIAMRPLGWQIGLLHSPATTQTTLSSAKLYFSLCEVDCLLA